MPTTVIACRSFSCDRILFTDEKQFTIEDVSSSQNNRIWSTSVREIPQSLRFIPRSQKPASLMVWAPRKFPDKSHYCPFRCKN